MDVGAYRWRTMTAVWFHAFHNAVSQVLVPKSLGIGDPRLLAESGALPVALYLAVAGVVVRNARMRRLRAVVERVRRRFLLHAFHPPAIPQRPRERLVDTDRDPFNFEKSPTYAIR